MEDNVEILFCDICGESVPQGDLDAGKALRLKGKIIGVCCTEALPLGDSSGAGSSPAGLTTVGAFVLAGVAAATIYLDSRIAGMEENMGQSSGAVAQSLKSQAEQWGDMQQRMDNLMPRDGNAALKGQVDGLGEKLAALESRVGQVHASVRGHDVRFGGLEESAKAIRGAQGQIGTAVQKVEAEVLRLGGDLARLAAAPRREAVEAAPLPGERPSGVLPVDPVAAALPAQLQHHVTRLKDADEGNRFDAVDNLVASKDPKVVPHLLPMLKDPDIFVRRLTAEGLSGFKSKAVVAALITALADSESLMRHTAYDSLKKVTGQNIRFDPDGSTSVRNQARRKWEDWWEKNQAGF